MNHLFEVAKMVCEHNQEEMCEFCWDELQDAIDWQETYNDLNRWVG